jgi:hypothetical protein
MTKRKIGGWEVLDSTTYSTEKNSLGKSDANNTEEKQTHSCARRHNLGRTIVNADV